MIPPTKKRKLSIETKKIKRKNWHERIDDNYVKCKRCGSQLKHKKTESDGNLKKHNCWSKTFKLNKVQTSITSFTISKVQKKKFYCILLKVIAEDEKSFRLISTDSFKELINFLNPAYSIPDFETIKKYLFFFEKVVYEKLKLEFKETIYFLLHQIYRYQKKDIISFV